MESGEDGAATPNVRKAVTLCPVQAGVQSPVDSMIDKQSTPALPIPSARPSAAAVPETTTPAVLQSVGLARENPRCLETHQCKLNSTSWQRDLACRGC